MARGKKKKVENETEQMDFLASAPTEATDVVDKAPQEVEVEPKVETKVEEAVEKEIPMPKEEPTPAVAPQPIREVQKIIVQSAGDQMMTVIHLYAQRTPIPYSNGKKKVFNRFGEKWSISVREFEQEFAPSPVADALLKQKIIAVGDDCPQEVRDRLDIDYDFSQLITPERYKTLLTLGIDEVCALFEQLCFEHKQFMAKCFVDDFENNDGRNCQREKIKALNDLSKKYVEGGERGMFASLLEDVTNKEKKQY